MAYYYENTGGKVPRKIWINDLSEAEMIPERFLHRYKLSDVIFDEFPLTIFFLKFFPHPPRGKNF